VPKDNSFKISKERLCALSSLSDAEAQKSIMKIMGELYLLCWEFDTGREYIQRRDMDEELISKIFRFVEQNFSQGCTLAALSEETSYHYVYLSRYFKNYTGISFVDYVNSYRINEACYMLRHTDESIVNIAYDSGFDSLRNFNRVFKRIKGLTPSEYKRIKRADVQSGE
jgi:AraC-like DNA-binding protein